MTLFFIGSFVGVFVGFIIIGILTSSQSTDLYTEISRLRIENRRLASENDSLHERISSIVKENADLQKKNAELFAKLLKVKRNYRKNRMEMEMDEVEN
ncbi:hypothetical protein [Marinitoga sp. 1138]|uniref:hypothetical protein n=1 Tax=Marinitoga sp. 1138 TaxID=1643334 RepID=UPI0015867D12|nr:hypothetical protein [Marinitoga sp. 1138]NUU96736.1 hypothetical protein [Marinitoga sp. 1138]